MKSVKLLLFAFLISFNLPIAQSANNPQGKLPLDTLLMQYYEKAASLMGEGELDSAQCYFDQAFSTRGVKKSPAYPILLNEQGTLYFYFGKLEEAREAKKAVIPYLSKLTDLEKHISVYNDLGILYHRFNQNDSSMYYYHKALNAAEQYKDASWLANLHMNVSVFYFNLKHFKEAEEHIDQALKYVVQTDDRQTLLYTCQVRAAIKAQAGKLKESGESIQKAWALACEDEGNTDWQMRCIPSLYRYFKSCNQPDSIDYYITKGNQLIKDLPANSVTVTGFIQVRQEAYYEAGRYQEALKDLLYLSRYEAGTNKLGLYEKMAHCYQQLENHNKAFAYMDSARMWTDSLGKEKVTQSIADFEVKYKTQEKELEIMQLKHKVLERNTMLLRIYCALLFLLAIILFLVYYFRQKQQKNQQHIEQLKREKELTAAKRYIEGIEEECKYFAKELHDGIANDLLGLQMKTAVYNRNETEIIVQLIGKIRNEIRNISHELMPPEFDSLSLEVILDNYAQTFQDNTGIDTTFTYTKEDKDAKPIPNETAREVYRIIQETIANIVKHTSATCIDITLKQFAHDFYQLTITDNGQNIMSPEQGSKASGIGRRTIEDRLKALGASTTRQTTDGINKFIITFKSKSL